jgi:hypothetical protein
MERCSRIIEEPLQVRAIVLFGSFIRNASAQEPCNGSPKRSRREELFVPAGGFLFGAYTHTYLPQAYSCEMCAYTLRCFFLCIRAGIFHGHCCCKRAVLLGQALGHNTLLFHKKLERPFRSMILWESPKLLSRMPLSQCIPSI